MGEITLEGSKAWQQKYLLKIQTLTNLIGRGLVTFMFPIKIKII